MKGAGRLYVALNVLRWSGTDLPLAFVRSLPDASVLATATVAELVDLGLNAPFARKFAQTRDRLDLAAHLAMTARLGLSVTGLDDPGYPELLAQIPDPPYALYHRGRLPAAADLALGVVGTRAASPYGLAVSRQFARDLASAGVTVVSGLAHGVDSAAHLGALDVNGRTIAVLASGVDVCYPAGNRPLYERLLRSGTIVAEAPPGTAVRRHLFPLRNRIISGLARAVVVTEAPDRSGALITARLAGEQGRDVFAVPGPVTSTRSRGCLSLLFDGAKVARDANDVLTMYGRGASARASRPGRDLRGPPLMAWLSPHGTSLDELVTGHGIAIGEVHRKLVELIDGGLVRRLPGNRYAPVEPGG